LLREINSLKKAIRKILSKTILKSNKSGNSSLKIPDQPPGKSNAFELTGFMAIFPKHKK